MNKVDAPLKPRILVAPLDWGLGHATRCIPIIRELITKNCEVLLACSGKHEALLRQEFPDLRYIPLPGYNIHYGKTKWEFYGKLLLQIPKILDAIHQENEWVEAAIDQYQLDAVISDNRYGLYSDRIPSVFITHQLRIQTSLGEKADNFLQKFNYHFVDEFSACWVPDSEDPFWNLSGSLSHPERKPAIPVHYVGPLSRFHSHTAVTANKHLLVILSGPEPQRTVLEEILLTQLRSYNGPVLIVRGLPGVTNPPPVAPAHFTILNHLPAQALETAIREASLVISRCGYSTVMDLVALQKKSILIPTPGQTEQEYLAQHLTEKALAFCVTQEGLDIITALALANEFVYHFPELENSSALQHAVSQLLSQVGKFKQVV
jgi:uncharacterized protein (TIGR00661 family)